MGSRYEGHTPAGQADGEAIATDAKGNTIVFKTSQQVTAVGVNTVTVTPEPGETLLAAAAFTGRWLQVIYGPGLGQSRKKAWRSWGLCRDRYLLGLNIQVRIPALEDAGQLPVQRPYARL